MIVSGTVTDPGHVRLMTKVASAFSCFECGQTYPKWEGRCFRCGSWNSIDIQQDPHDELSSHSRLLLQSESVSSYGEDPEVRHDSGISELDRVFGGGIVRGSTVLLAGEPGVGKSTLATQICSYLASSGAKILYASGEETPRQIVSRVKRISRSSDFALLCTQDLGVLLSEISREDQSYELVVVDSLQAFADSESTLSAYGTNQTRANAQSLCALCKSKGITLLLLGQITKDGSVLGPKSIEHLVDVVAYFERSREGDVRSLEVHKNRFGSTPEFAEFTLSSSGLSLPPEEPVGGGPGRKAVPGRSYVPISYGSRYRMTEIQALVSPSYDESPKIYAEGFEVRRLQMLMAIIDKELAISLQSKVVLIQVVGGRTIRDHGGDLAVAAALVSAATKVPISTDLCSFGELSLLGEVRPMGDADVRLSFARSRGFKKVVFNDIELEKSTRECESLVGALGVLGLHGSALRAIG